MEVIQKETIKEVPANYWCDKYDCNHYNYRYGNVTAPFASRGVAGAGLGLNYLGQVNPFNCWEILYKYKTISSQTL